MAVNILSSPTSPITVDDLIQWKMEITDLGTPLVNKKTIGYQLTDGTGVTEYTNVREISPDNININPNISFANELYNIKTLLPTILTNTMQDGGGIMKVKLKYGEITHDFTTGATTGLPLPSSSATIDIINSCLLNYKEFQTIPSVFLMSPKLPVSMYNVTSVDWLYGYGAATVTIKNPENTVISTMTGVANKVNIFPIGAAHFPALSFLPYYTVTFQTEGYKVYTYRFKNCGLNEYPYQVLYLDPLGGYTAMTFTEVNIGMDVQKDEIKTHRGGIADWGQTKYNTHGGNNLANVKGYTKYDFELKTIMSPDAVRTIEGFLGSSSYLLVYNNKFIKFKVTESGMIKEGINMRIKLSGNVANPVNAAIGIL